jgi:hypothetical protein
VLAVLRSVGGLEKRERVFFFFYLHHSGMEDRHEICSGGLELLPFKAAN